MSDEGLMNVEDDGPATGASSVAAGEAPPVAAAEQAPAVPPEQPGEQPAEVEAVEVAGQRYVPAGVLRELQEERKQRKEFQKQAAELESYARESKPYVEFLKANPGLISGRQQPQQPAAPQPDQPDPQAEQLAKTLDLYTPEGKPDIGRAATIRNMMTATAQQIAQQTIAPMVQESDQTKSARNYQVALTIKDAQGRSPSPQALQQIWRTMDPRQTADPNVASILALTALGLDSVSQKPAPVAPAHPPIITEGQGGSPRRPAISALEANVARERGVSAEKWAEHTKGFTPGRATQLED
jgi:hypothetical protein